MREAVMTGAKQKTAAKQARKKWPSAICPRCLVEPDADAGPSWAGDLVEVPTDLREPGAALYTHECQICGLQVYLEPGERRRVARNKTELFALMGVPDASYFPKVIAEWTPCPITYEPIDNFDGGVCLYAGAKGFCLEYPIDVRELRSCCQVLEYVHRQHWKHEAFS